jgi:FkbM family methyltransferase
MIQRIFNKLLAKPSNSSDRFMGQLRRGDVAIDAGANVGWVTESMLNHGAVVYAFEPNPFAFDILRNKFIGNPSVHCMNKGVYDRDAVLPLYLHENSDEDEVQWSQGTSLLPFKSNVRKDKQVNVELVDLAAFIRGLGNRVKLLKIDIEGAEYEVLTHVIKTGAIDMVDTVIAETHADRIPELRDKHNELLSLIEDRGLDNIHLDWE